jgi:type VI protein secretion system component VasK
LFHSTRRPRVKLHLALVISISPSRIEVEMSLQSQVWVPVLLSLVATLIVVVLAAWWNARSLSDQMRMLESKLDARLDSVRSEIQALRAEMKQSMAELELRLSKQIMEIGHRVDRLEETRGLVRP